MVAAGQNIRDVSGSGSPITNDPEPSPADLGRLERECCDQGNTVDPGYSTHLSMRTPLLKLTLPESVDTAKISSSDGDVAGLIEL